jgi:hypothetical protein
VDLQPTADGFDVAAQRRHVEIGLALQTRDGP